MYIDYKKKSGSTVILATHEEQEIRMCDRLYLLKEGRLMPLDFDGNIHTLVGKI